MTELKKEGEDINSQEGIHWPALAQMVQACQSILGTLCVSSEVLLLYTILCSKPRGNFFIIFSSGCVGFCFKS
jgi:hypothetical protein